MTAKLGFDDYLKNAEERFKNHKAKLLVNTEDIVIIDWRNKDGKVDYYINFIVDKRRGSLHIDGDLGSSIATWYNSLTISDLKSYIYNDVGYYMSKFRCASDDYYYYREDIFDDFVEAATMYDIVDYIENSDDYENFDEFKEDVSYEIDNSFRGKEFVPTERLYEIAKDIDCDASEWLFELGKRVDGRVYLWVIGFKMAVEQLEEEALL